MPCPAETSLQLSWTIELCYRPIKWSIDLTNRHKCAWAFEGQVSHNFIALTYTNHKNLPSCEKEKSKAYSNGYFFNVFSHARLEFKQFLKRKTTSACDKRPSDLIIEILRGSNSMTNTEPWVPVLSAI